MGRWGGGQDTAEGRGGGEILSETGRGGGKYSEGKDCTSQGTIVSK